MDIQAWDLEASQINWQGLWQPNNWGNKMCPLTKLGWKQPKAKSCFFKSMVEINHFQL